eukprot:Transcript_31704.p1 GENE.Transcript_31704~~Transcript_31704.p1  ORF type:complete len:635 (-),score=73.64 Transcript_31704:59-1963(-)
MLAFATAAAARLAPAKPPQFTDLTPYYHPSPHWGMHTNDVNAPFHYNGVYHVMTDGGPVVYDTKRNDTWGIDDPDCGCNATRNNTDLRTGCCNGWTHYASTDLAHWHNIGCAVGNHSKWTAIALDTGSATMVDGKPVLMWPGVHNASAIAGDAEMRQPSRPGVPGWESNAMLIATPKNLSDPWLWDWVQPEAPVMACQAAGPGHVSRRNFSCPMNESSEFADPSQGWLDNGEYHIVVGQGLKSEDPEGGPTSSRGTQALLCSSKDFVGGRWRCDDVLWKFGTNESDDPIRGVGLYGGMSCPDFWRLHLTEDPLEDLWVFNAAVALQANPAANPDAVYAAEFGSYWVGRYHSTSERSAKGKHFVPIDPVAQPMFPYGVPKSFYDQTTGRQLMWASHGQTLSIAIVATYDLQENKLLFNPVGEVELLHSTPEPAAVLSAVTLPPSREPAGVSLPGASGSRLDVVVNLTLPDHATGAQPFGDAGGSVGFGVMCDPDESLPASQACAANATFSVSGAGQGFAAVGASHLFNSSDALKGAKNSSSYCNARPCARLTLPADGKVSLRLLVDGESLELFANGGRAVVHSRVGGSANLKRAKGGGVRLFLNASSSAAPVRASAAAWHMECGDMKRCSGGRDL